jgi:hypothetical protein
MNVITMKERDEIITSNLFRTDYLNHFASSECEVSPAVEPFGDLNSAVFLCSIWLGMKVLLRWVLEFLGPVAHLMDGPTQLLHSSPLQTAAVVVVVVAVVALSKQLQQLLLLLYQFQKAMTMDARNQN